jgi:dihydroxyacetone kinase
MKKLINRPENLVREMCHGIVLAHPELELLPRYRVIKRKIINPDKVSLISGGGSGHEPAHAGFVGTGMLDAAVCGEVFSSPSQIQVYQAIRAAAGKRGVLLIIKNYSGDIMNFQNAAHMAREGGVEVDYVKTDDDVAVRDSLYTVGRRGVAGTVFVHKLAGAAAEQGCTLSEVKAVAELAIANTKSLGFALTSCTVPARGSPTIELGEDEMEYGVGIHGEPGVRREPVQDADELACRIVRTLCGELGILNEAGHGRRVALMVNGFGATPLMELYLFNAALSNELYKYDVNVTHTFVGNFMTSIDMAGASVTLLKLNDELEALLDAPCDAPGLKLIKPAFSAPYFYPYGDDLDENEACFEIETPAVHAKIGESITLQNMIFLVDAISASCIRNERAFCELDSHAGDGDFGVSVANGFRELKRRWKQIISGPDLTISAFLGECSLVIMEHCGGASGPIWGSAFRAAGRSAEGLHALSVSDMADMLRAAIAGIRQTGERSFGRGAEVGDKTLIDALAPCADAWCKKAADGAGFAEAFTAGARAAAAGAKSTEGIVARMGRAGLVGERSLGHPDAGAHALGVIFTEISQLISS